MWPQRTHNMMWRFGLDNPNEVFIADDRSYGLIKGTAARANVELDDRGWMGIAGIC